MALPRKYQILTGQPGFYHCYSRCVRRAFLCGHDPVTGQDFSHRRQWIVDRLALLSHAFAIDVYAYAVMSNHCHIVLFVDPQRVGTWSDEEVIQRWRSLFQWRTPDQAIILPTPAEVGQETLALWRERLASISWFMKSLNEPLARIANAEDGCQGHFWQSRFGCTALLDDPAVLAAMAYVDLNPIKAHIADSLATSDFTSIQLRLQELLSTQATAAAVTNTCDQSVDKTVTHQPIQPVFQADPELTTTAPAATLASYIAMLEAAVVTMTEHPLSNPIPANHYHPTMMLPPQWLQIIQQFEQLYRRAAGSIEAIDRYVEQLRRARRIDTVGARLLSACHRLFEAP